MADKSDGGTAKGAAVIGSSISAIQAALTLAQMGIPVKLITRVTALSADKVNSGTANQPAPDRRYLWPLMVQAVSHPLITLYSNTEVESIAGEKGNFQINLLHYPRYIYEELCTGCGRCEAECSASVTSLVGGERITHGAIHAPIPGAKSVPSAYQIDKNGFPHCRVGCPLGINVPGFISLLSKGKTDKALALITEAAPFAGILGRVCRHPCEDDCNRAQVDSPVYIRALHRFAADNAPSGITYTRKAPAYSQLERIAIIGSGPAGLTAAWELNRRGYSPTVFESHGVIGGLLATGIPRFRLPREVREREIRAIQNLGVDIRTGITVGRDITYSYLRERGFHAFFLAIGAGKNNRLNVAGEHLNGVVDCMSLLITLNLMVDTFVGANIVIIGDGNSAIDSARTAIRKNRGSVRVLSWTVPEEITANEEELNEALQEGVSVEYTTAPVEILGENGKVAGIHCQKTRPTDKLLPNGQHLPEPIPGTDFIVDADHVVVAIGQTPDASQLNIDGLEINSGTGVIKVDPLTLETSVPGVFSGGDCITGPNNVVAAMAAGLRAAESIDRYLQGCDLSIERTLEPPPTAEIDIETAEIAPYKRVVMPTIRPQKRLNSYEETTTGLSASAARRESQRCLNCGLCSQCLECAAVCELNAVFHEDSLRRFEIAADAILHFPSAEEPEAPIGAELDGIRTLSPDDYREPTGQLAKAMALALETILEIKPGKPPQKSAAETTVIQLPKAAEKPACGPRSGVFLCRCGGSISSVIDFRTVSRRLTDLTGVTCVEEIAQACTEEGARQIAAKVAQWQLDRIVLAACRCCGVEQVCYSCTDRRQMCLQSLNEHLVLPSNTVVEFCNIREQCAWAHQDDPRGATRQALPIIVAGVARAQMIPLPSREETSILPNVLVVGSGKAGVTAAEALAQNSYHVDLLTGPELNQALTPERDLAVRPWPDRLTLIGTPGNYQAVLENGGKSETVKIGAVLIDMDEPAQSETSISNITPADGLLGRILSRRKYGASSENAARDQLREITIKETAGIFILPANGTEIPEDRTLVGLMTAARITAYLEKMTVSPRGLAIVIDSKMCRGCGNCAEICPYIDMQKRGDGSLYADIDRTLCLGCGACIATCPTGAITQPRQSDKQVTATLRSLLQPGQILSKV